MSDLEPRRASWRQLTLGSTIVALSLSVLILGQGCSGWPQVTVGKTYNVAKATSPELEDLDYWVCGDAGDLAKVMSISRETGFAERLADARMLGCVAISAEVPGAYQLTVLQQVENLVQVRITTRNEVSNNFVGWTDVSFLDSDSSAAN
jgi:hypothetical protein